MIANSAIVRRLLYTWNWTVCIPVCAAIVDSRPVRQGGLWRSPSQVANRRLGKTDVAEVVETTSFLMAR